MKKGFTLVELLAVIVILAIILAIAIPSISKIMESVQANALINNTQMMLKATKNYIALEQIALPNDIGTTKEIKLSDLQSKDYIGDIVSPSDKTKKCNGYIIITKIDNTNYDYSPHLNCANNIGSVADDNLLLHYKFDDFQEPTDNLARLMNVSGHGSQWVMTDKTYNGKTIYENTVTSPNTANNYGFRSLDNNIPINQGGSKGITISFDNNIVVSPGPMSGYVRVLYTDGTSEQHNWSYSPSQWYNFSTNDYWQRVEGNVSMSASKTPQSITSWYVYKDFAPAGQINVAGIQIEQKKYATPYTATTRSGEVKDYSGNGYNATLNLTNTPKWINKGIAGTGAYEFDGVNDYISVPYTAALAPTTQISFSFWLYKADWSIVFGSGFSALSKTEGGGYNCNVDSDAGSKYMACLVRRNGAYGMVDYQYTSLSSGWHNFVTTYDGRYLKLYVDGLLQSTNDAGATYPIQYSVNNNLIIGGEASGGSTADNYFKGSIDDVQIYSRALTNVEINQLYQLGSKGY